MPRAATLALAPPGGCGPASTWAIPFWPVATHRCRDRRLCGSGRLARPAPERAAGPRGRRGGPAVSRDSQGRPGRHRILRDRPTPQRRHRLHGAVRDHRRCLPRSAGLGADRQRASRSHCTRIMVGRGSAYDLFLTRELKAAQLLRTRLPRVWSIALSPRTPTWPPACASNSRPMRAAPEFATAARTLHGHRASHGLPLSRGAAATAMLAGFVEQAKVSGVVGSRWRATMSAVLSSPRPPVEAACTAAPWRTRSRIREPAVVSSPALRYSALWPTVREPGRPAKWRRTWSYTA